MGTTAEWIHILVSGGIFGILMFLWDAFMGREFVTKWANIAILALISLAWGMMFVLGWRVLHGAMLGLFALIIIGLFVVGLTERRNRKRKGSIDQPRA